MEEEEYLPLIRDWSIDIRVVFNSKKPINQYVKEIFFELQDEDNQNYELINRNEKEILESLKENSFTSIKSYFESFAFFPSDGTFLANEYNAPLFLYKRYIHGEQKVLVFICLINDDDEQEEITNPLHIIRNLN